MTTTTSVADSYNSTVNRVANLSDVGNVSIGFPSDADDPFQLSTLLPFAVVAVVGVVALVIFGRKA